MVVFGCIVSSSIIAAVYHYNFSTDEHLKTQKNSSEKWTNKNTINSEISQNQFSEKKNSNSPYTTKLESTSQTNYFKNHTNFQSNTKNNFLFSVDNYISNTTDLLNNLKNNSSSNKNNYSYLNKTIKENTLTYTIANKNTNSVTKNKKRNSNKSKNKFEVPSITKNYNFSTQKKSFSKKLINKKLIKRNLQSNVLTKKKSSYKNETFKNHLDLTSAENKNKIDSLLTNTVVSDCPEDCIVTVQIYPKKKKEIETKKPDTIKTEEKFKKYIIFSPIVGLNKFGKIGTENLNGNTDGAKAKSKYGQMFGAKIKWLVSEKTGIQFGAIINKYYYSTLISKKNNFIETESINLNQDANEFNQKFGSDSEITFEQNLQYLEIPIEAYYYINTNKLNHAISFGLSFYFPLKNEIYAYSNNVNKILIGESDAYLKQGYGLNLNYYLNYKITKKIEFYITPAVQFQFLGNLDYVQPTATNISLGTGINYKF